MKQEKSCGCVIIHQNKVLLIKHNSGHWDFPKGHMEEGETEEETAKREVFEETGLTVEIRKKHRYTTQYMPKADVQKEVVYFQAKKKSGTEMPQLEEVEKMEWVPVKEAFTKITFENSRQILKQVLHDRKEVWDLYDENRQKLFKTCVRDQDEIEPGEYHLVVEAIILNSNQEILLTKRAPTKKKHAGLWEATRGSVVQGETSLEAALRELSEEIGLIFEKNEPILFSSKIYPTRQHIKDIWVIHKDLNLHALNFKDGEVCDAKWVNKDTYLAMQEAGEIVPTMDFGKEEFEKALTKKQRESYQYLGREITIKIDRRLGSSHPCHDFIYPVNYGYVPDTKVADGEEQDAYLLGVWEPVEQARGICIAVIHRLNDDDDKLVIAPSGKQYSDDAIKALTEFQERFFETEIIR